MPSSREPRQEWDRLEGETGRAFAAFRAYLEMGTRRSLAALWDAQRSDGDQMAIATRRLATLRRWSVEHRWQARIGAWEQHLAHEDEKEFVGQNKARARRMARLDEAHGEALSQPTQELLRRLRQAPELLSTLGTEALLEFVVKAARAHPRVVQAERLSRGMSTDAPGHPDDDRFSRMGIEELDAYLAGVDDGRAAEAPATVDEPSP
jgi:hypothetical protein